MLPSCNYHMYDNLLHNMFKAHLIYTSPTSDTASFICLSFAYCDSSVKSNNTRRPCVRANMYSEDISLQRSIVQTSSGDSVNLSRVRLEKPRKNVSIKTIIRTGVGLKKRSHKTNSRDNQGLVIQKHQPDIKIIKTQTLK